MKKYNHKENSTPAIANPEDMSLVKEATSLVETIGEAVNKVGNLILKLLIAYFFLGSTSFGDERSHRFANWCAALPGKIATFWQNDKSFQIATIITGITILVAYLVYFWTKLNFSFFKTEKVTPKITNKSLTSLEPITPISPISNVSSSSSIPKGKIEILSESGLKSK